MLREDEFSQTHQNCHALREFSSNDPRRSDILAGVLRNVEETGECLGKAAGVSIAAGFQPRQAIPGPSRGYASERKARPVPGSC